MSQLKAAHTSRLNAAHALRASRGPKLEDKQQRLARMEQLMWEDLRARGQEVKR